MIRIMLCLFTCLPLFGQIQGIVVDAATQQPINGARVRIQFATTYVTTDEGGFFSLNDSADFPFRVTAAAYHYFNGFVDVDAKTGTTNLRIELDTVPTQPDDEVLLYSPTDCESCHPNQVESWSQSPMRKTGLNTWVFDVYDGTGTAGGSGGFVYQRDSVHYPANFNSDCSACHSPVHWLKTFEQDPPVKTMGSLADINADMQNGVQCEICHRAYDVDIDQTYMPGVQKESFHLLTGISPVQFGLLGDSTFIDSLGMIMRPAYNPILSAQLCSACHEDTVDVDNDGDFSPEDGSLDHETTFSEWRAWQALSSDNTQTCIDCHMPLTQDTWFCVFEGFREPGTIRDHDIRGTTPQFLENALTLEVTERVELGSATVDVAVHNNLTGHAVPTGVVIRNVLLLVQARDQDDDLMTLLSGDLIDFIGGTGDVSQGYYAGQPGKSFYRNYRTALGEEGVFYTEAAAQVSDTRIQPGQSYQGAFRFKLTGVSAMDLEVKLIYRRAFRDLVDAKGWTQTGHGEPLVDIQAPHFGHLMESYQQAVDVCGEKDRNNSGSVTMDDIYILADGWLDAAPFAADQEAMVSIRHLIATSDCLVGSDRDRR
ncbi:MAG: carboxypeptidase regulatory-like domain-containing protein [Acidobacteriota bacterium]|nr:carboxypeptidase regulatory-like domain-containing protein [Acidobacteriota bacterium]